MGSVNIAYQNRVRYTLSHKEYGTIVITEPIGWNDDEKEYARNKKYHGIFTKFSNNLEFIEDGATFINDVRDFYGINAEIRLVKEERHPITDNWTRSYEGVLDLSEWSEEDFKVKCKFNSSGLETEIKARESEKIEIERLTTLDGSTLPELNTHLLELEGRKIFLLSTLESIDEETKTISEHRGFGGKTIEKISPFPLSLKKKSHVNVHSTFYSPNFDVGESDALSNVHCFIADLDRDRELNINFDLSFLLKEQSIDSPYENEKIQLRIGWYGSGTDYVVKEIEIIDNLRLDEVHNYIFKRNYSLLKGDSLSVHFFTSAKLGNTTNKGHWSFFYKECRGSITIEEDSFFEKTSCKVVKAEDLGDRLIKILTGRDNAFVCDYLSDINKGYAHGHWIRNFDKEPEKEDNKYKPFTTSLKDFLEDLEVTEKLGSGIEKVGFKERLVVRPVKEYYNYNVLIKLPNQVSNLKRKTIKNKYYSSLTFGYAKGWDNEEAMGLDEYNTQTTFPTPIVRIKNEFKKISKYIYASYAGEFIRRKNVLDFPTEDHRNDKEIFGFDMKPEYNYFKLKTGSDGLEKQPTGVYSPETAYNLKYSPFNLLLKHGWDIASSFTKNLSEYIRFGSSEGNSNLKTQILGNNEYAENGDIICSELERARFVPEEITFNHEVTFDILEQIEGETIIDGKKIKNLYGLIQFTNEKGELEHGFFDKLKPNKQGTWTLIKANR